MYISYTQEYVIILINTNMDVGGCVCMCVYMSVDVV